MGILTTIYNDFLYKPLFNAIILLYNIIPGHDFGIAIIIITVLIRIILFPLSIKGVKSRKALEDIQSKVKEVQSKYKDKKEQAAKLMALYKENKVNPASGCLPLLIQLPIIIALYRAFINVINPASLHLLYPFIKNPGVLNTSFLGVINLSVPNVFLAIIAGIFQFIQGKVMTKTSLPVVQEGKQKAGIQKALNTQMIYFMPVITVIIALKLPAGLPLYWAASTLFGIGEYLLINHKRSLAPQK
jgi:YidC/Oxa1 family membrane protein insertase